MRQVGNLGFAWGWLFTLLALAPSAGAEKPQYFLTGVIASSTGQVYAVIETADGQQRLLREGDPIGSGQVMAISPRFKTVRLRLPNGDLVLALHGSARLEEYEEEQQAQAVAEYTTDNYEAHEIKELSGEDIIALTGLAEASRSLSDKEAAVRMNEILDLSVDAQIVALNRRPVGSPRKLARRMIGKLPADRKAGDVLGSVSVNDKRGNKRIYLRLGPKPE